jgi:hypothetical protein
VDRRVRRAVMERLAAVEELTLRAGAASAARTQLKNITGGWREVLAEHQPNRKGRCPVCSGWMRRRRWPCQVWVTAHQHLIGDGSDPIDRPVKKSNPFRRPRQVEVIPRQTDVPVAADQTARNQNGGDPAAQRGRRRAASAEPPTAPSTGGLSIHRAPLEEREPSLLRSRWTRHS